jgi:hypothetical protein
MKSVAYLFGPLCAILCSCGGAVDDNRADLDAGSDSSFDASGGSGGGTGGSDGGAAGAPSWSYCDGPGWCAAETKGCCGVCGKPTLSDFDGAQFHIVATAI